MSGDCLSIETSTRDVCRSPAVLALVVTDLADRLADRVGDVDLGRGRRLSRSRHADGDQGLQATRECRILTEGMRRESCPRSGPAILSGWPRLRILRVKVFTLGSFRSVIRKFLLGVWHEVLAQRVHVDASLDETLDPECRATSDRKMCALRLDMSALRFYDGPQVVGDCSSPRKTRKEKASG